MSDPRGGAAPEPDAPDPDDAEPNIAGPDDAELTIAGPDELGLPVLPEPVRLRVVVLAAEALSRLAPDQVPRPLRRVAAFAPSRRARLAGGQILGVLESDPAFRAHLAAEVEKAVGDLARALRESHVPAAADPVELAATAYLLRPPGWVAVVSAAAEAVVTERQSAGNAEAEERLERARRRVADLEAENHDLRARHREQVDRVKAENSELRHRLGETRVRLREAQSAAESRREAAAAEQAVAQQAAAAAESEGRRLRARLTELET
ncbi:MAG: hypothetical protein QOK15_2499, partial [Nocardioidaceae bacterium]|nr:hypothetical protein [Nocardioidaceae bacterium]